MNRVSLERFERLRARSETETTVGDQTPYLPPTPPPPRESSPVPRRPTTPTPPSRAESRPVLAEAELENAAREYALVAHSQQTTRHRDQWFGHAVMPMTYRRWLKEMWNTSFVGLCLHIVKAILLILLCLALIMARLLRAFRWLLARTDWKSTLLSLLVGLTSVTAAALNLSETGLRRLRKWLPRLADAIEPSSTAARAGSEATPRAPPVEHKPIPEKDHQPLDVPPTADSPAVQWPPPPPEEEWTWSQVTAIDAARWGLEQIVPVPLSTLAGIGMSAVGVTIMGHLPADGAVRLLGQIPGLNQFVPQ